MDHISQKEARSERRHLEERVPVRYLPYIAHRDFIATPDKKQTLFYLANDIVQVSRRKGTEFVDAFGAVLGEVVTECFKYVVAVLFLSGRTCSEEIIGKVKRVLKIWEDRQVFPGAFLKEIIAAAEAVRPGRIRSPSGADRNGAGEPEAEEETFSAEVRPPHKFSQEPQLSDFLPGIEIPEPTEDTLHELLQLLSEQKGAEQRTHGIYENFIL